MLYECIGGPWCGKQAPSLGPGMGFVLVEAGTGTHHFYRLCVTRRRIDGRVRRAKFWHYMGTHFDIEDRPRLSPPQRLFR